jgi:hypothetical protein
MKKLGIFTISRSMIGAGVVILAGLAVLYFKQVSTIDEVQVGGPIY